MLFLLKLIFVCNLLIHQERQVVNKHVGFSGSVVTAVSDDTDSASRPSRLHRRDTPHHLKNKRINAAVDKDKVASIIAQVSSSFKNTLFLLGLVVLFPCLFFFDCFLSYRFLILLLRGQLTRNKEHSYLRNGRCSSQVNVCAP